MLPQVGAVLIWGYSEMGMLCLQDTLTLRTGTDLENKINVTFKGKPHLLTEHCFVNFCDKKTKIQKKRQ